MTQSVAATNVRVLQTALVEQSRKTPLDGGLMLCKQLDGPCTGDGINLGPNSSNKLWLRTSSAGTLVGKYIGTVAGVILITLLQSILSVIQMEEAGRQMIYGVVIIAMLLLYGREKLAR